MTRHPFATSSERAAARWHATTENERAAIQRQCGPLPPLRPALAPLPRIGDGFRMLSPMLLDQFKTPRA